jgi:hypothetical protein
MSFSLSRSLGLPRAKSRLDHLKLKLRGRPGCSKGLLFDEKSVSENNQNVKSACGVRRYLGESPVAVGLTGPRKIGYIAVV